MPIISMFYGIIIRMYSSTTDITICRIFMPSTPSLRLPSILKMVKSWRANCRASKLRLVQAWIELHRDELKADWELAAAGENPYKISPL